MAAKKATKKAAKKTTKKAAKKAAKREINPREHALVPTHEILAEEEIQTFFDQYDIQPTNLPTIYIKDAALEGLEPKIGDIIKITRKSLTSGTSVFYRRVAYE